MATFTASEYGMQAFMKHLFAAVFLGHNQYWPDGFMVLLGFLYPGAPEGSTGSGSDLKAFQKTGPRLKSHPTDRLNLFCFFVLIKPFFVAFPWVETSTGPGWFMICVFII